MLELVPNDHTGLFSLANAYFLSKKFAESKQVYQRLLAIKPGDLKATYNLAEACFNLNQHAQALELYQRSLYAKNVLPYIRIRMANCLERLGRPHEAKNMVEKFLQEEQKGASPEVLAQLKQTAHTILGQMNKKYPGKAVVRT